MFVERFYLWGATTTTTSVVHLVRAVVGGIDSSNWGISTVNPAHQYNAFVGSGNNL